MNYTENEVREVALRCMGFMVGQFDEINKSVIPDSAWAVEPNHIRSKAFDYLDTVMADMKKSKQP
jgi:hypothetical protein